jgi:two-component system response regulator PilR (NtrC family)
MRIEAPALAPDAVQALKTYQFPGNVRELENILERAITLSAGGVIGLNDIQLRSTPAAASPGATHATGALGEQLEDIEREAIVKALEQTRYNKTAAAKLLGMSFRALRYRVKKLGLE